jgi:hypothetical protein
MSSLGTIASQSLGMHGRGKPVLSVAEVSRRIMINSMVRDALVNTRAPHHERTR